MKNPKVLFLTLLLPGCLWAAAAQASADDYYEPKPIRLELPLSWEKAGGKSLTEHVAGIYELDYKRYDFQNQIALTIDDCAPNAVMAADLDILKKHGIKAVFFIIGRNFLDKEGRVMPRAKELLDRVVAEGHVIGNHSYWHRRMDLGSYRDNPEAINAELDSVQSLVDRILGYHYKLLYFRPPGGAHGTPQYGLDLALKNRAMYLTNWTITSFDWCMRLPVGRADHLDAAQVLARSLKQAKEESGGVLLVHAFKETTAILDQLLDSLSQSQNQYGPLQFSTLETILRLKYADPSQAAVLVSSDAKR